jgi:hypothetical protein
MIYTFGSVEWLPLWYSDQISGYKSSGPGSVRGATRFSEKYWVWNGVYSAWWVQLRTFLEEKVSAPV